MNKSILFNIAENKEVKLYISQKQPHKMPLLVVLTSRVALISFLVVSCWVICAYFNETAHIWNHILVVMVQDWLWCLELPGVHFSSPKLFEDTLEASDPSSCQYFNTDDYKRAGLNLALTVSPLREEVQREQEWICGLYEVNV